MTNDLADMALESEPAQKQEKFSYRKTWRQAKQLASGTRWRLFFMLLIACLILGVCYYALRPASVHVSHMALHNHLLHVSIAFAIGSALMSIYLYLTVFKLFLSKYFGNKLRILYRPTFSELVGIVVLVALFICLSFKFQYRTIADQFAYIDQMQHIAYLKQHGVDVSHMVLSKPQTSLMWLFMVASFFGGCFMRLLVCDKFFSQASWYNCLLFTKKNLLIYLWRYFVFMVFVFIIIALVFGVGAGIFALSTALLHASLHAHSPGAIFFVIAEMIALVGLFVFMLARYLPVQMAVSICLYLQLAEKHKRKHLVAKLSA